MRFVDRGISSRVPLPVDILNQPDADIGAIADGQSLGWQQFYVQPRGQSVEQPYIVADSGGNLVLFALLRHAPNELVRATFKSSDGKTILDALETTAVH